MADFEKATAKWKDDVEKLKAVGPQAGAGASPAPRKSPDGWLKGNGRPGNIFNGVMNPDARLRHQGRDLVSGRKQREPRLGICAPFPLHDRAMARGVEAGRLPLLLGAACRLHRGKVPEPGDSAWAELRESQTKTMKLPNTGQCVIIDLGEGKDIHPKNKHDVAARLVRWALAKDYGHEDPLPQPRVPETRDRRRQGHRGARYSSAAAR